MIFCTTLIFMYPYDKAGDFRFPVQVTSIDITGIVNPPTSFGYERHGHANSIDALSFCLEIAFYETISMDDPFNLTDNVYTECRGPICQGNEFQQRAYSFEWQLVVLDRFNFISRSS